MKRDDTPMWNDPEEPAYVRELLQAGRSEPIDYDVSAGLAKHLSAVQTGAPLPDWAQGGALTGSSGAATTAWVSWVVAPIVAATLATGVWLATRSDEAPAPAARPSAAVAKAPTPQPTAAAPAPANEAAPVIEPSPAAVAEPRSPTKSLRVARKPVRETASSAAKVEGPRATKAAPSAAPASALAARSVLHETQPAPSEAVTPVAPAPEQPAAEAAPTPAPKSEAQSESQLEREMQMLAVAQRVLGSDPERALRLAEQGEREFPRTMFSAERKQLALLAMVKLGRVDEARRIGQSFLAKYPNAPWSARLRRALATGRVE